MNCGYSETAVALYVALYVEGDLPESQNAEIETHLRSCPRCGELAASFVESQSVFKSLSNEPPPDRSLQRLRARTLEGIRRVETNPAMLLKVERALFLTIGKRSVLAGLISATAVVALAVGISMNMGDQRVDPSKPAPATVAYVPVEVPVSVPEPPAPVPVRREQRRPAAAAVRLDEPARFITIVTEDPNVVIHWALD